MPIHKTLVVDPLVDMSTDAVFAVEKSSSIQNFYNIQSNNVSANSITYVVNCNSETTITDRVWLQDVEVTFVLTFNTVDKPNENDICLRPNALSLVANSIVLQQGNASTSIQSSEIASALQRYGWYDKFLNYSEANPSYDMTAPYVTGRAPFTSSTALIGNKYQERTATSTLLSAAYGAGNTLTLRYRILEPVLISPLLSGLEQRKEGLRRISQFQLQYNFGSWTRALSVCPSNATCVVNSVVPTVNSAILHLLQAIPSPLDVGRSLSTQILPYDEFVSFNTDPILLPCSTPNVNNGRYGTPATFNSAVIQVSRIPEAIYIYCRPNNQFMNNVHASDTFATYVSNTLAVNFNGVNQFQNCSDISLYRICRQNSCNIPWPQWSSSGIDSVAFNNTGAISYDAGVGSVICLKLSKDITLDASLAPSTNTKVNLQISAQFANNIGTSALNAGAYPPLAQAPYNTAPWNAAPYYLGGAGAIQNLPFTMYTVIHYSGCQETYSSNTVATTIGVLSTEDVLNAQKRNEKVHYSVIDDDVFGGASIFDRVKKFLKEGKLTSALKQLKQYLSHPLAKEIGKTAKDYLRGREGAEGKSDVADLIEEVGLGMSGGKRLTKAQLKRHLLGRGDC
jgi:hypothetical protein